MERSGAEGPAAEPTEGGAAVLGEHRPRLDEKGRLFLPAKFRDDLAEGLVITKGQDRCLYVFPQSEWARIRDLLRTAPLTASTTRTFARVFFASASDEQLDRQGRITIPATLRQYAGLDRDCVVIGADTRAEIWDAPTWDSFLDGANETYASTAQEVLPGVL